MGEQRSITFAWLGFFSLLLLSYWRIGRFDRFTGFLFLIFASLYMLVLAIVFLFEVGLEPQSYLAITLSIGFGLTWLISIIQLYFGLTPASPRGFEDVTCYGYPYVFGYKIPTIYGILKYRLLYLTKFLGNVIIWGIVGSIIIGVLYYLQSE